MNDERRSMGLIPVFPISLLTLIAVIGFEASGLLVASVLAGLLLSKEVVDASGSPVPRWITSLLTGMIVPLVFVFSFNIIIMLFTS